MLRGELAALSAVRSSSGTNRGWRAQLVVGGVAAGGGDIARRAAVVQRLELRHLVDELEQGGLHHVLGRPVIAHYLPDGVVHQAPVAGVEPRHKLAVALVLYGHDTYRKHNQSPFSFLCYIV